MIGLLVVTHGRLAEELVSAVRTIVGPVDALEAVLKASGGASGGTDEVEAGPSDLREGMTVSRDVRGARGELLIPARSRLTQAMLQFLQERPEAGRGAEGIFIFRLPDAGG